MSDLLKALDAAPLVGRWVEVAIPQRDGTVTRARGEVVAVRDVYPGGIELVFDRGEDGLLIPYDQKDRARFSIAAKPPHRGFSPVLAEDESEVPR